MNTFKIIIILIGIMILSGCDSYINPTEIRLSVQPNDAGQSTTPEDTQKAIEIIKARFKDCQIDKAFVSLSADNKISIKLPLMTADQLERVKKLALATGKLEFKLEADPEIVKDYTDKFPTAPTGYVWYDTKDIKDPSWWVRVLVHKKAELTGESLVSAYTNLSQMEGIVIGFKLNPHGAKIFADVTSQYAKSVVGDEAARRLAIIFDDKLIMAPIISNPILGGEGIITGHFTKQEANDIAAILRNGQMSLPLKIISDTTPK